MISILGLVITSKFSKKLKSKDFNPEFYLIKEDKSRNTIENALFSKKHINKDSKILILSTSRAYKRVNMVFKTIFHNYETNIFHLREQTKEELKEELHRTIPSYFVLSIPTDTLKIITNDVLYWVYIQLEFDD